MSRVTPIAFVIDRAVAARVADAIEELGGAWAEAFHLWQRSHMQFLVMLAHTKRRLRLRAPLTYMAANERALAPILQTACANLDEVECRWVLCLEDGSAVDTLVRQQLLLDTKTEGRA